MPCKTLRRFLSLYSFYSVQEGKHDPTYAIDPVYSHHPTRLIVLGHDATNQETKSLTRTSRTDARTCNTTENEIQIEANTSLTNDEITIFR
jgi:hypothetical protein